MAVTQRRSRRSLTGSRYKKDRKKRLYDKGSSPALTKIGKESVKAKKGKGGNFKDSILQAENVNLLDKESGKNSKAKIVSVVETPANRHFVRRNIITKGCVIMTDKGKAVVTSRPGQEGSLNAVLVKE